MSDLRKLNIVLIGLISCILVYLYGFVPIYPGANDLALFTWLKNSWNVETNYEHGWVVFPAVALLIYTEREKIRSVAVQKGRIGLIILIFGLLLYLAAMRASQPRLAFFGLSFILYGMMHFAQGWQRAKHVIFAVFFIYFAIPMPGLQQATNGLQLIVSKSCFVVGGIVGYELVQVGNTIKSVSGSWDGFDIAEGCSGIRSLIALIMVTAVYAQYTQQKLWKKAVIFLSAFPLAIFGNFLRIFTIIVIAEMGYSDFAANLYHDWAGMLIFFPVSLTGVFIMDKLININKRKRVSRREVS
ncbi:MAG: exosortase/archaeosortase family protein [Akkermansiaceae bacterium]